MNSEMDQHSNNEFMNIIAFCGSVAGFVVAHLTQTNIAWFVGIVAGVVSVYSGILNIREKRIKIRQMNKHNNFYKDKKGYNGK